MTWDVQVVGLIQPFFVYSLCKATNANEADVCRKQKLAMQTSAMTNHYSPDAFVW